MRIQDFWLGMLSISGTAPEIKRVGDGTDLSRGWEEEEGR